MRMAVISDIHSNIEALETVLDYIDSRGVDEIVCLGDVIGYGPNPVEVIDATRDKCRFIVKGNHDDALAKGPEGFSSIARGAIEWTRTALKVTLFNQEEMQARWDFLANLPERMEENGNLFVHGSPRAPTTEYIFQTEATRGPSQKFNEIFAAFQKILFVGHTHFPCVIEEDLSSHKASEIDHSYSVGDKKVIVNVGSVGQPRDGDNRSCYAEFDGSVVTWHRVPYDFEKTREKIQAIPSLDRRLSDRLAGGY